MTKVTIDRALIEQAVDAAFSPYCAQDLAILAPALRAALAEPAGEPVGWQPIETAPRYGRLLVTGTEIGTCVASAGWDTGTPDSIRWEVVNEIYVTPTHWMPLPAVPGATSPPPPAEPAVEPTCKQPLQVHKPTGWVAHKNQYAVPVLFNPYTGEPRDVRDVQSDPQGVLIVPPGKVDMIAASPPPPAEWDVRKIMLEVVPGADGMGYEVYAKNVSEVVNKLTEMGQRIEDLEGASPPPPAEPVRTSQDVCTVPLLSDEEMMEIVTANAGYGGTNFDRVARAVEQLVRRAAGLK